MTEMTPELQIRNIDMAENGMALSYIRLPTDARKNGLVWQHNVLVPYGSDYDDEIADVVVALKALLVDVLDDEDRAEVIEPIQENEEEDDEDD